MINIIYFLFFFFSSRRRHTRCYRDWSSDVCSSDLADSGGQAQKVVSFLEDAGFVVLPVEPAPAGLSKSEIVYRKGFTGEERVVASYLSSLNSLYNYRYAKNSGANVAVVIGSDFKGLEF